jgi:TolB-like protein/Flp pilus assembly protein TadD
MQNQNRQLAAILFTDIVGYTSMMQQNEVHAVAIVKRYLSVLKKAVTTHTGEILNDYGDGSLCVFSSATSALNCAVELQQQLQQEPSVPLRIGIHIGEIFFEDGKVFGDGVNIASRIQSLGQADTILFSGEINNKIKNNPEFRSVLVGRFEFKNVDDPVDVFALANQGFVVPKKEEMSGKLKNVQKNFSAKKLIIASGIILALLIAAFAYKSFSGKKNIAGKDLTIAILPFKNISINKEENEPFCVGVALELQKKMELMGGLIPIASQSVEKFRDTKLSVGDIASELGGIKYIVQGNVQRDKNKVKVFVSLIDAASNQELWRDDFPGEVEDIFSLQENIAQQIASALEVKITPDEQSRISRAATNSATAIDAYNEALTSYTRLVTAVHPLYWDSLPSNPQFYSEYAKTLSLCDKAIKTDPSMAEAYVLKGQTYFYSIYDWYASNAKRDRVLDSVKLLAKIALQIDRSSADAYLLLSRVGRGDSVLTYLQKAIAISPNNFDVNREAGNYYAAHDPEKSIRFSKKAIRLNPLSLWTPLVYRDLGFIYHTFGDFEKAEFYGEKAIELSSNSIIAIEAERGLVITYLHWGKADSALKYANQYLNQNPSRETNALYEIAEAYCNLKNDCAKASQLYQELWSRYENHFNIHRWAVALMNIGKTKEAKEKIEHAVKEYKERNDILSYDYAGICALNGDKEKAINILSKFDWQWGSPYLIQHDKLFDNIRNEKEFKDILRKALDEKKRLRDRINKMEADGKL